MTQPKVVFLSRKWPPAVGGMETYALRISEELSRHVDLTCLVLPGNVSGQPPSAPAVLAFGLKSLFTILARHRKADVIHVGDMASWPVALAAGRATVVLSAHGTDVAYPLRGTWKGRLYGLHLKIGARLLGRPLVIANSRATEAAARSLGFDRTVVVPLATDFTRQIEDVDTCRLLFSGRLTPLKGLSWFVANVLDRLPGHIHLDVAGTIWDPREAKALDHPRVHHLGHLTQGDLARAYARALAVVVPNVHVPSRQFEGFGLVAVEAAAAGGVVLASDDGGLREAVLDGETGFSLPVGDAKAWIETIGKVAAWTDAERGAFTERASETAIRVFSWDRVARDTIAAYEMAREGRR